MKQAAWDTPITLEDPETGNMRTVRTVRQAKVMLDRFWPAYHGSQYRKAEKVCDDVLNGGDDETKARQAFIAAAVEAHFRLS
ncbi:uncharacterized protein DUF982 [Rhizobium azibense]|uniref:Uncharacterized protein DUF982 n=1 Tax=Rhizobium azibense TaxID=1136135 RepID=A0A4R3RVK9_9HYPH|nr:DUF982 domain-containing protein [Rhizobium azibense]TCU24438.1 uncharacterized protein DUF982 [Rhizobium azibense]TCU39184.1 uncharacterized protein DUF982 [Rhizobium azibense]